MKKNDNYKKKYLSRKSVEHKTKTFLSCDEKPFSIRADEYLHFKNWKKKLIQTKKKFNKDLLDFSKRYEKLKETLEKSKHI